MSLIFKLPSLDFELILPFKDKAKQKEWIAQYVKREV